jgi:uncharacterized protein YbjT (DUF2867 family)
MIVVTTPTGHIGSRLAKNLAEREEPLRVIARDPSRLAPLIQERAEVFAGSHADPAVLDAALAGADAYFLIVPPDRTADSVEGHYLEYARQARAAVERSGVGHVVGISTMGGGTEPAGHLSAGLAMDGVIGESGAAYRAIAPPFFMENLLGQIDALRAGVLALPGEPDRILPVVASDDLAARAADLLTDRSWDGVERFPISSPDALSPVDIAAVIAEAIDRDVTFQQVGPAQYRERLRSFGLSDAWADGLVEMALAQNAGFYDPEMDTARGIARTTLAAWCAEVLRPAVDAATVEPA